VQHLDRPIDFYQPFDPDHVGPVLPAVRSLPGYLNLAIKLVFLDYQTILAEYGGYNQTGINLYRQQLVEDLNTDFSLHDKIIGQSILGGKEFVSRIKDNHLKKKRANPEVRKIHKYLSQDIVLPVLADEFGVKPEKIFTTSKHIKQITITVLYNYAGLNNREVGKLFGVDYSTVSQNRKRLRERVEKDKKTETLLEKIELKLSRIKI